MYCAKLSTHVMLGLNAEMAGLAPSEDTEPSKHDMLHLDDELAGLIAAADTPADQAGAHSHKPEPASSLPGKVQLCLLRLHFCLLRLHLR